MLVVEVCIEVYFDFEVCCCECVNPVYKMKVIGLGAVFEYPGEYRMELAWLDFGMIVDIEKHLYLVI